MNAHLVNSSIITNIKDYGSLLRTRNLKYREIDHYLQIGNIKKTQGWIIHISAIISLIPSLIHAIVPVLKKEHLAFKIVRDQATAQLMLDARLGYSQVGKIVCIYPENDAIAQFISQKIIDITKDFVGPEIPTDAHLGGTVYTRYGSFNPILITGANGQHEKHIYNAKGQLIKDSYSVPFSLPDGITWPFNFIPPPSQNSLHVLNNSYLITSEMKADVKGRVFKAIRIKNWTLKQAVVKEAKHHQSMDEFGRDIISRLRWQYYVQKKLHDEIAVPRVYDIFEQDGNCYIGMEYISGETLLKHLTKSFQGTPWNDLSKQKKLSLIDSLLQILVIIEKMHALGFIHRDISPANFIVNKDKIIMIDLEGAYSINENQPSPPYTVGTPGFTAPEQETTIKVSVLGDIYSIGGLIFLFFTGISPGKFISDHPQNIVSNLSNFNLDAGIHSIISQCLSQTPTERPKLPEVTKYINEYREQIERDTIQHLSEKQKHTIDPDGVSLHISKVIAAYDNLFTDKIGVWHTNFTEANKLIINRQVTKEANPGLFSGVSGGLYLCAKLKSAGMPISRLGHRYASNYKYIQQAMLSKAYTLNPGLYFGSAGIALGLAIGIQNKLLSNTQAIKETIKKCLTIKTNDLTLSQGIAGQCLSIIQCQHYLSEQICKDILDGHIQTLLEKQKKDGSWLLSDGVQFTGVERGMAGIALALLTYYNNYPTKEIKQSVLAAFDWLESQTLVRDHVRLWRSSNRENAIDPWLNNGISGIAVCHLIASQVFQDSHHQQTAQVPLNYLTNHLVQNNFSLAYGLSGLGEAYLEANLVGATDQYQEQINYITNLIISSQYDRGSTGYWIVDDERDPDGSIMTGNGGIIHYLLRVNNYQDISFPIFRF